MWDFLSLSDKAKTDIYLGILASNKQIMAFFVMRRDMAVFFFFILSLGSETVGSSYESPPLHTFFGNVL